MNSSASDIPTFVALVGAPRSGTTWLQRLLAARPEVVSPQETDVFSRYLAPLDAAWDRTLSGDDAHRAARRYKGLASVLTANEFGAWTDDLVTRLATNARAAKPSATIVVEKSPSHSLAVSTIERHAPNARYLHIIRDGRDVAASLVAASRGWGEHWAPASIAGAARVWRDHVEGARTARRFDDRYHEVRYEVLRGTDGQGAGAQAADALHATFAFLGLAVGPAECTELLRQFSFDAMQSGSAPTSIVIGGEMEQHARDGVQEPEGFLRRGAVGGWREEWSNRDRAVFASRTGSLLVDLGYEADHHWAAPRRAWTAASLVNRAVGRVGRAAVKASDARRENLP